MNVKIKRLMPTALMLSGFSLVLAANAETYLWTGGAGTTLLTTPGNWSLSDGSATAKAPGVGDTVVFENAETLSLTKGVALRYLAYEFRNANVSFPKGSGNFRQYGYGGGGITASGEGHTYAFGYPLELLADQFTGEEKTFVVDVASGSKVQVTDSGTLKLYAPAVFVKRGAGTFQCTQFFDTKTSTTARGDIVFEEGVLTSDRASDRNNWFGGFSVKGSATKRFVQDAMHVHMERYSETPDAALTMTFYNGAGTGYLVDLQATEDVARFSANVTAAYGADNTLNWNPVSDETTMTMVRRIWDSQYGKIRVSKGTMRFAEGAGVKQLGGLTVKSGATLAIAATASGDFSGAALVLEAGAKLKIEGGCHYFKPKSVTIDGVAVAAGVYSAGDLAGLEGDGHLIVGAVDRPTLTLYWTGEADEASKKFSTSDNWRCEDGSPVSSVLAGDTRIFTNDTALAIAEACTIGASAELVKRGAGELVCSRFLPEAIAERGRLTFEEGTLTTRRPDPRWAYFGEFVVTGPAAKRFNQGETSGTLAGAVSVSINRYVETEDASKTLTFFNYQGNTYVVELCGAYDVPRFSASLWSSYGENTLKWNPGADKTLTMVDRVWNADSCNFLVASGTMRFGEGAGVAKLKSFRVQSGACVEISSEAGSFTGNTVLALDAGAKLRVETMASLPAVSYEGQQIADGVYAMSDFAWLEGDENALLVVGSGSPEETVAATWTGNGDGRTITDPANWGAAGSTSLPDFTSGTLIATFPANATIVIPSDAIWKFKGLVVDPSGKADDHLVIQGSGEIWVGAAGLVSHGAGAVSIAVKTGILSSNPWSYGMTVGGGSLTFTEAAEVFTVGSVVWTVETAIPGGSYGGSASGPFLQLNCQNPQLKDSHFGLPVRVTADAALGGAQSVATIDCFFKANLSLMMTDCHLLNKRIVLLNVGNMNYLRAFRSVGSVTLDGELYFGSQNASFWSSVASSANEAQLRLDGGWVRSVSTTLSDAITPIESGYRVRVGTAMSANKIYLSLPGAFSLATAESTVPRGWFLGAGASLTLETANAFKQGTDENGVAGIGFVGAGTVDLGGSDQTLQIVTGEGAGVITSASPATLTLNANVVYETVTSRGWEALPTFSAKYGSNTDAPDGERDVLVAQQTDYVSYAGTVSVVKTGSLPHRMGGVSTTTGSLDIRDGTLTLLDGARWRTTPSVTLSGSGRLAVEGDRPFGPNVALAISGDATDRIAVAAGKRLTVASLTINGTPYRKAPDGLNSGAGELRVGAEGLLVIFK